MLKKTFFSHLSAWCDFLSTRSETMKETMLTGFKTWKAFKIFLKKTEIVKNIIMIHKTDSTYLKNKLDLQKTSLFRSSSNRRKKLASLPVVKKKKPLKPVRTQKSDGK